MRNIQTTFYGMNKAVVKTNRAKHDRSAVLRAVDHLQMNSYGAAVVEVVDMETSELHAVLTHSTSGRITVVFQRDPTDPKCIVLSQ